MRVSQQVPCTKQSQSLLARFGRDQSGNFAIIAALVMPLLAGTAGLGAEYGMWIYKHQAMIAAAGSSAVSAATASNNIAIEADAVAASYGFVNGVNGTTVVVNQPPQSGTQTNNSSAVEVVIQQTQPRLLSALFDSDPITIKSRAVAISANGAGCVLALNPTADGAVTLQGSTQITLNGCSLHDNSSSSSAMSTGGSLSALSVNVVGGISGSTSGITATNGIHTGVLPTADPYASASPAAFSGCNQTHFSTQSSITINPGVYCGGMSLTAGAVVTLNPGIYYLDQGSLFVRGGATITGKGVTLVFTSSTGNNWATATINGNASVNLTAPAFGPTAGIVMFGDRKMTTGTSFKLNGGASQTFGGAIYLPTAAINYSGSSSTNMGCTQIIADTITFSGNSNVQLNCSDSATTSFGIVTATLVE